MFLLFLFTFVLNFVFCRFGMKQSRDLSTRYRSIWPRENSIWFLPEGASCEPSHPLFNVVGFFARKHKRAILLEIISFFRRVFLDSISLYVFYLKVLCKIMNGEKAFESFCKQKFNEVTKQCFLKCQRRALSRFGKIKLNKLLRVHCGAWGFLSHL